MWPLVAGALSRRAMAVSRRRHPRRRRRRKRRRRMCRRNQRHRRASQLRRAPAQQPKQSRLRQLHRKRSTCGPSGRRLTTTSLGSSRSSLSPPRPPRRRLRRPRRLSRPKRPHRPMAREISSSRAPSRAPRMATCSKRARRGSGITAMQRRAPRKRWPSLAQTTMRLRPRRTRWR